MKKYVKIKLKQFILMEECPEDWKELDLYLFRDEATVFYVGQSFLAFTRVWDHIRNGYKARSDVGRFILCNWPKSMNFDIELFSSKSEEFDDVSNSLALAEERLIKRHAPCFNGSLNASPVSLPSKYDPPNSPIRCSRSLNKLKLQASLSVKNDEKINWIKE